MNALTSRLNSRNRNNEIVAFQQAAVKIAGEENKAVQSAVRWFNNKANEIAVDKAVAVFAKFNSNKGAFSIEETAALFFNIK